MASDARGLLGKDGLDVRDLLRTGHRVHAGRLSGDARGQQEEGGEEERAEHARIHG